VHPPADLIPVDDERAEGSHDEDGHKVIEECGPSGDEADSVADSE
jgi:hypothetical protein